MLGKCYFDSFCFSHLLQHPLHLLRCHPRGADIITCHLQKGIEQGITSTSAILPYFIGRKRSQYHPYGVGMFVHPCLGTVQRIGHMLGVIAKNGCTVRFTVTPMISKQLSSDETSECKFRNQLEEKEKRPNCFQKRIPSFKKQLGLFLHLQKYFFPTSMKFPQNAISNFFGNLPTGSFRQVLYP